MYNRVALSHLIIEQFAIMLGSNVSKSTVSLFGWRWGKGNYNMSFFLVRNIYMTIGLVFLNFYIEIVRNLCMKTLEITGLIHVLEGESV